LQTIILPYTVTTKQILQKSTDYRCQCQITRFLNNNYIHSMSQTTKQSTNGQTKAYKREPFIFLDILRCFF